MLVLEKLFKVMIYDGKFPGGPVVRTLCFHCWGLRFSPCQETKILQAVQHDQKKSYDENRKSARTYVMEDIVFLFCFLNSAQFFRLCLLSTLNSYLLGYFY